MDVIKVSLFDTICDSALLRQPLLLILCHLVTQLEKAISAKKV